MGRLLLSAILCGLALTDHALGDLTETLGSDILGFPQRSARPRFGLRSRKHIIDESMDFPPSKSASGVVLDKPNDPLLWENAFVPYALDNTTEVMEQEVLKAIETIEENTCIRFSKVEKGHKGDHINIQQGRGCSSYVGRMAQGVAQGLNLLPTGCTVGSTIHELFHALGVYHQHTRPDRDEYVNYHEENVIPEYANNFRRRDINVLDTEYEMLSIMHYSSFAFSNNSEPTLTRKDGSTFGRQRETPKPSDWDFLNSLYCGVPCEAAGFDYLARFNSKYSDPMDIEDAEVDSRLLFEESFEYIQRLLLDPWMHFLSDDGLRAGFEWNSQWCSRPHEDKISPICNAAEADYLERYPEVNAEMEENDFKSPSDHFRNFGILSGKVWSSELCLTP